MIFLLLLMVVLVALYTHATSAQTLLALAIVAVLGMFVAQWDTVVIVTMVATWILFALLLVPNPVRQHFISRLYLGWVRSRLPTLSDTENEALQSGDVDWDGELFSGKPNWRHLLDLPHSKFTDDETQFIEITTSRLCEMLDDWKITQEYYDLPPNVWQFIKKEGFFGLVIPKEYGGKGFSATAHSEIVMKLSTRSIAAAVTVMVPNSLGPAELLLHYGTAEQKQYYLPRLATGEEIPCFALTSPLAGSDAGAIPDVGVVTRGIWKGEEVLGLSITWNKRYITLAPIATLIGLAIKVIDPQHFLGDKKELGVTCVMVPYDLPGVHRGPRHLPMNTMFMNGPTTGENVFVPFEQIIGGATMIGKGWAMLVECLSIGRAISLPALGTGAGKYICLTTGAYAAIRSQFGYSISAFEGVQEALEPIAGYTFMMDAARRFTSSMIDRGINPSVPSAILKYRNTELMRDIINHAMDIVAGRAIITGPRNFLARVYQAAPISITVEGANILTRSLIIYGQGAVRCHPYLVGEISAAALPPSTTALKKFDKAFFGHIGFALGNTLRTFVLGLSHGTFVWVPAQGKLQPYYRQLSRFSAAFSMLSDVNLAFLGGALKARERLSGRMADCLIHLYFASAAIKQFHEDGYPVFMRPLVEWALKTALFDTETQLRKVIDNYPVRGLRPLLRLLVFPLGLRMRQPDDILGAQVARSIIDDSPSRHYLSRGVFVSEMKDDAIVRVLNAYRLSRDTFDESKRLFNAVKNSEREDLHDLEMLLVKERTQLLQWAIGEKVLNASEAAQLEAAMEAVYDAIQVDAFDPDVLVAARQNGLAAAMIDERKPSSRRPETA